MLGSGRLCSNIPPSLSSPVCAIFFSPDQEGGRHAVSNSPWLCPSTSWLSEPQLSVLTCEIQFLKNTTPPVLLWSARYNSPPLSFRRYLVTLPFIDHNRVGVFGEVRVRPCRPSRLSCDAFTDWTTLMALWCNARRIRPDPILCDKTIRFKQFSFLCCRFKLIVFISCCNFIVSFHFQKGLIHL